MAGARSTRPSRFGAPLLGVALVLGVLGFSPRARAEMSLGWEAPAGCPQRGEVLERMRALTGGSIDRTEALSVEGRIEQVGGRFSLTLLVNDGRDVRRRVITSASCADLAGAAAVTLALLLGIDVVSTEPPDEASPDAASNASTSETQKSAARDAKGRGARAADRKRRDESSGRDRSAPDSEASSAAEDRFALLVRAPVGAADLGPMPRLALGAGLGVGLRYAQFRLVLSGRVFQGQSVSAPAPNSTSGAELDRLAGELALCRGFRTQAFEIAPCLALGLEHVTAEGFGPEVEPQTARATFASAGAGVVAYLHPWEFLAFFAGVTGSVELSRPRLVIQGLGDVGELEPVTAGLGLGVEWIF